MKQNIGKTATKKLAKNVILSITAQMFSLLTSFVLGFIVPKFIDEYQYSYWQSFLLYVGYVNVFQFGILDGFILRYSQYDVSELDKPRVRSQFQTLLAINVLCSLIGVLIATAFVKSSVYKWVMIFVCLGIVSKNIFTYHSYVLQSTNRINKYAIIVIAQRLVYAAFIIILLLLKVNDFYLYCIADVVGDIAAIIIGTVFNKGLCFGKGLSFKETCIETRENVSSGILLLVANLSSGLLLGCAKMVTQWRWGELVFGKVSFAFSLFGAFLSFAMAIGVVFFPALKRTNAEELPNFYKKTRNTISLFLFLIIIAYFPLNYILRFWLPNYEESLMYLGILLPLAIFTAKVMLLTNNYLKVYRKEKIMLIINIITLGVCFLACLASAYLFNSLDILIYSLLFVCMMRSIVSEIVVMRIIKQNAWFDFAIELIMTVIFVVAARYFSLWTGFLIYAVALAGYCILYRKNLAGIFRALKKKVKGKSGVINKE